MDITNLNFDKLGGLIPVIVQDYNTKIVLMQAFVNEEALQISMATDKLTFFSRTKQRLWTKGESSGNFLFIKQLISDCDNDCILALVEPAGPVCHTGEDTCWSQSNHGDPLLFLKTLQNTIEDRKNFPKHDSYVSSLFDKGINKIAQKVGEEAIELVIEAKDSNHELFLDEAADLLFHFMILLSAKNFNLQDVAEILDERHKQSNKIQE